MPRRYQKEPDRRRPKLLKQPRISLEKLFASAHPDDRKTARSVQINTLKEVIPSPSMKKLGYRVMKGITYTQDNSHQHEVRVYWQGEEEPLKANTKVIVDCSCPRFAFYYEYANAQRGASFIYRCNGEAPVQTNPRLRVGCCKHIFRVCRALMKRKAVQIPAKKK